ncbi:hypothetical protein [Bradyrhizobium sp. LMG 9283]|uniref:hypothetical protein n=1 Tax=Bradyrhizobium sp. LMG 9283 TaxID=592064 RepID=UPI003890B3AE
MKRITPVTAMVLVSSMHPRCIVSAAPDRSAAAATPANPPPATVTPDKFALLRSPRHAVLEPVACAVRKEIAREIRAL